MSTKIMVTAGLLSFGFASSASAHIIMTKPAPWIEESFLGDPQKYAPCGPGPGEDFTPTNAITEFKAGEEIEVAWQETIPHPGHFRIALAKNRADLKDPDFEITGACSIDPADVPKEPHGNVLVDNLFPRTSATAMTFTTKVKLPNEPCDKCTLQLIQFMTQHAQPCIYYHCADIKIVAAPGSTAGSGGQSGGGGAGGSAGASGGGAGGASGMGAGGMMVLAGAGGGMAGSAAPVAGTSGGAGMSAPTMPPATGTTPSMMNPPQGVTGGGAPTTPSSSTSEDSGGCGVAAPGRARAIGGYGGLLLAAVVWTIRQRRRSRV
jgi:hypothetical protein